MRLPTLPGSPVALVGLAALLSCALSAGAQSPGPRNAAPDLPGEAALPPVPAASMAAIVADLEGYALVEMKAQRVPGLAFAIVQGDALVHAKGYGYKTAGGTDPVGAHTVFEVGSTTKAFTAALVGMLVDQGALKWNDSVVDLLPGFRLWDPWVTKEFRVDDLMAQRSGMPAYSLDVMSTLGWPRHEIADAVAFVEPTYSARSEFSYVNTLWLHASFLVEKYGGLSWENAMARRILGPLEMNESTVDPEVVPLLDDVATGHMTLADGTPWILPADWPYGVWLDTYGPAGSLRSNVVDMSKWARMHLGNGVFEGTRLLSAETVSRLHAPRTAAFNQGARATSYAQGWVYDSRASGPVVWHDGGTSGMHSIVCLYPSVNVALVVLTNTKGNKIPEGLDTRLYALLFPGTPPPTAAETDAIAALLGPPPPRRLAADPSLLPGRVVGSAGIVPPLPLSRYVGTFGNPAFGRVAIREKGGSLAATIGPKSLEMPFTHYAGNVFVMTFPGYPESESLVTFDVPSGGPATRVQFDAFKDVRGGWCERVAP